MKRDYKIVMLVLSIMLILFLTKCNQKEVLTFEGESENWEGAIIQESDVVLNDSDNLYEIITKNRFKLKYKGENIENVGLVHYRYERNTLVGSGDMEVNQKGEFSTFSEGGAPMGENTIITVTVEWKDNEETFEMSLDN